MEHDLEALCWVLVHAVYAHALDNAKGTEEHQRLRSEYGELFSAISAERLSFLRRQALGGSRNPTDPDSRFKGIRVLTQAVESVDDDLAGFLELVWDLLRGAQPPEYRRADLNVRPKYRQHFPRNEVPEHSSSKLSHATLLEYTGLVLDSKSE